MAVKYKIELIFASHMNSFRTIMTKWLKRGAIALGALVLLFFIGNWVFPLPDKVAYSTIITDAKGEVIHSFLTPDQKWRMKTELDEISPLLRKTIVQKEDK